MQYGLSYTIEEGLISRTQFYVTPRKRSRLLGRNRILLEELLQPLRIDKPFIHFYEGPVDLNPATRT